MEIYCAKCKLKREVSTPAFHTIEGKRGKRTYAKAVCPICQHKIATIIKASGD
jgi:hypothetical protein